MGSFHLSLPVPDVERSVAFFQLLGGTVTHRDATGYVNLEIAGVQLTVAHGAPASRDGLHFGLNVDASQFGAIAARLQASDLAEMVATPRIVDEGTPLQRTKMYVRCPAGYLIELKGF